MKGLGWGWVVAVCLTASVCAAPAGDLGVYLLKDPSISLAEAQQTALERLALQDKPLLCLDDFQCYQWPAGRMTVTPEAFQRVPKPGVYGVPFVMVAGGRRAYPGVFRTMASSVSVSPPAVVWIAEPGDNSFRVGQGYPQTMALQSDPRDRAVREAFQKAGKLRVNFQEWQSPSPEDMRRLFLEVRTLDLLPDEQAREQIAHLYRDVFTEVMGPPRLATPMFWPDRSGTRTAEAMAADATPQWLLEMARMGCFRVLNRHPQTLKPLVAEDIRSKDDLAVYRALEVIAECSLLNRRSASAQDWQGSQPSGWQDFYRDVARVFRRNKRLSTEAANTLMRMDDPRAVRLLAKAMPSAPALCEQLRVLQKGRPAEPVLVEMLGSRNPETRWRTAYALAESGDSALTGWVQKLAKDSASRVRLQACEMGFALGQADFRQVRAHLLPLLQDPDAAVRERSICLFARRVDRACAPAALAWLRDESLDSFTRSNAAGAMRDLSGRTFGYDYGQPHNAPVNKHAVDLFAAWVKEHCRTP